MFSDLLSTIELLDRDKHSQFIETIASTLAIFSFYGRLYVAGANCMCRLDSTQDLRTRLATLESFFSEFRHISLARDLHL